MGHKRTDANIVNDALNYAYAIVRALISRSITAHGLYPPLGIHHKNEFNNFNLADDLIEPFRPIVDLFVRTYPPHESELSRDNRHTYTNLAHLLCRIDGKRMTISAATQRTVSSLIEAINAAGHRKLSLPHLDGIELKEDII